MGKTLVFLLFLLLISLIFPESTFAQAKEAGSSAKLASAEATLAVDNRAQILREYLTSINSPLAGSSETFVMAADKYDLDWKLVASIAGVESTYGRHMPSNSYNAWGWGVYGDKVTRFESFDHGILTISEGLRTNYINKGAEDVYQIGRIYAASPTWATKVNFFMNQLEQFEAKKRYKTLSISI